MSWVSLGYPRHRRSDVASLVGHFLRLEPNDEKYSESSVTFFFISVAISFVLVSLLDVRTQTVCKNIAYVQNWSKRVPGHGGELYIPKGWNLGGTHCGRILYFEEIVSLVCTICLPCLLVHPEGINPLGLSRFFVCFIVLICCLCFRDKYWQDVGQPISGPSESRVACQQ